MTKTFIVAEVTSRLAALGFLIRPDASCLGGQTHHRNARITVRAPRGQSYSSYASSLIFEADGQKGSRGRRFSQAELVVHIGDLPRLEALFEAWLPVAEAALAGRDQEQAEQQSRRQISREARQGYVDAGFQEYQVIHDVDGMPTGVKVSISISGSPAEALKKLKTVRKVPEILALLERTQARLQGELLPLSVSIRQEISDLLTSLTK